MFLFYQIGREMSRPGGKQAPAMNLVADKDPGK